MLNIKSQNNPLMKIDSLSKRYTRFKIALPPKLILVDSLSSTGMRPRWSSSQMWLFLASVPSLCSLVHLLWWWHDNCWLMCNVHAWTSTAHGYRALYWRDSDILQNEKKIRQHKPIQISVQTRRYKNLKAPCWCHEFMSRLCHRSGTTSH